MRERVVKGLEAPVTGDCELEALASTRVLNRDGQRVVLGMPEQLHVDAVALARGELSASGCCLDGPGRRTHDSSLRFAHVKEDGAQHARRLCGTQGKTGRASRSSRHQAGPSAPAIRMQ